MVTSADLPAMRRALFLLPLFLSLLLLSAGCGSRKSVVQKAAEKAYDADYKAPRREVRAVWFPTIYRSQYAQMTVAELQSDLRKKVDRLADLEVDHIDPQLRQPIDLLPQIAL